jgi:hypothetical protein
MKGATALPQKSDALAVHWVNSLLRRHAADKAKASETSNTQTLAGKSQREIIANN